MSKKLDQGTGAWVAQHHDDEYPIELRSGIWMDRLVVTDKSGTFHSSHKNELLGDYLGLSVWRVPQPGRGKRPMAGWSLSHRTDLPLMPPIRPSLYLSNTGRTISTLTTSKRGK